MPELSSYRDQRVFCLARRVGSASALDSWKIPAKRFSGRLHTHCFAEFKLNVKSLRRTTTDPNPVELAFSSRRLWRYWRWGGPLRNLLFAVI